MNPNRFYPNIATALLILLSAIPARGNEGDEANSAMRVACIGDSITFGVGTRNANLESYPAQLDRMLGEKYTVRNFGVSGATLLNHGDRPYQKQAAFKAALDFKPEVVVIMLGTNDTKPQNWKFKDEFVADYKGLIAQFAELPSKPKIFLCQPVPVAGKGNYGIVESGVDEEMPMIARIAEDVKAKLVDTHAALTGKDELIPDRVHPNAAGATLMAKAVYEAIAGKPFEGDVPAKKSEAKK
ncbi:MAG TPA: GDSL-type esterase/lipase family protein [Humisphaera sp.]|nr:GDSL-type esterase/lipase family protein [Humisphaera sp.]